MYQNDVNMISSKTYNVKNVTSKQVTKVFELAYREAPVTDNDLTITNNLTYLIISINYVKQSQLFCLVLVSMEAPSQHD